MNQTAYRRRLEADLVRWVADGIVSAETAAAIRAAVPPGGGVNIANVVAILGGLLIAAAFLAFVAANWAVVPRPARFAILLVGIAAAYAIGAAFDRRERPVLADLSVAVGCIVFGAAIALVGQMYHLGEDFAAGLMLWAGGALVVALLTGSRGALAVALAAGLIWSGTAIFEAEEVPHLPFVVFWLLAACLAVASNSAPARHLVAAAAVIWWVMTAIGLPGAVWNQPGSLTVLGAAFLLGAGLLLSGLGPDSLRVFGRTLATYAVFAFAIASATLLIVTSGAIARTEPRWLLSCGIIGAVLAGSAAIVARRAGPALLALAIGLELVIVTGLVQPARDAEPYLVYLFAIVAMLSVVIAGALDELRPRVVAGWLGLGLTLAAITWLVRGSLIERAFFLAAAGAAAVGLAMLLGRIVPQRSRA
jgi:uncharacterized membrane protein